MKNQDVQFNWDAVSLVPTNDVDFVDPNVVSTNPYQLDKISSDVDCWG